MCVSAHASWCGQKDEEKSEEGVQMQYQFTVPENKRIRVIISSDAKNEADDQYAITHALMTPKFKVRGIVATHFAHVRPEGTMDESYAEVKKVLQLMGREDQCGVFKGAEGALPDEKTPGVSEGAQFIIDEAMKTDALPLYAIFIGALTDLASAYLMEPRIAENMIAIWVGGGTYPDGHPEFNLMNDVHAANVVFKSTIPLWQVPVDVCSIMKVSFAELQYNVRPCGQIGQYLFEQMMEVAKRGPSGCESWIMWDSSAIGLLMDEHAYQYDMKAAPSFTTEMNYLHNTENRPIRVYRQIDSRFIFEDFFCKLAMNYPINAKHL